MGRGVRGGVGGGVGGGRVGCGVMGQGGVVCVGCVWRVACVGVGGALDVGG